MGIFLIVIFMFNIIIDMSLSLPFYYVFLFVLSILHPFCFYVLDLSCYYSSFFFDCLECRHSFFVLLAVTLESAFFFFAEEEWP